MAAKKRAKKRKGLQFEYCECGCHGYSAGTTHLSYWVFWDLKDKYYARRGHGWIGVDLGTHPSLKLAYKACNEDARRLMKIMQKELLG